MKTISAAIKLKAFCLTLVRSQGDPPSKNLLQKDAIIATSQKGAELQTISKKVLSSCFNALQLAQAPEGCSNRQECLEYMVSGLA